MVQSTKDRNNGVLTLDTLEGVGGLGYQLKQGFLIIMLALCTMAVLASSVICYREYAQQMAGHGLGPWYDNSRLLGLAYMVGLALVAMVLMCGELRRAEHTCLLSLVEQQHYLEQEAEAKRQRKATWTRAQLSELSGRRLEAYSEGELDAGQLKQGMVRQVREFGLLINLGTRWDVFMPWRSMNDEVVNAGDLITVQGLGEYRATMWGTLQLVSAPYPYLVDGGSYPSDEEWFWGLSHNDVLAQELAEDMEAERLYHLNLSVA